MDLQTYVMDSKAWLKSSGASLPHVSPTFLQMRFNDPARLTCARVAKAVMRATAFGSRRVAVPHPRQHSLHQVAQCQAQRHARLRLIKGDLLRRLYNERDLFSAFMQARIESHPESSAVLRADLQAGYDRFMRVINHYNRSASPDLGVGLETPGVESISSAYTAALMQGDIANQHPVDSALDLPDPPPASHPPPLTAILTPWQPGTSACACPRLPGAPFAALPH